MKVSTSQIMPLILVAIYSILTLFVPDGIHVVVGVLLSLFLFKKYQNYALIVAFLAFYIDTEIIFGQIISLLGVLLAAIVESRKLNITRSGVACLYILLFYLIVTIFNAFTQEINDVYFDYLLRNVYKEFIIPVYIIFVLSCSRRTGYDFYMLLLFVSVILSFIQLLSVHVLNETPPYLGFQFTVSLLVLFSTNDYRLRLASVFNVTCVMYMLVNEVIYFSSQDVVVVLACVIIYAFLYRTIIFSLSIMLIMTLVLFGWWGANPYLFLQDVVGLSKQVAFKLSQIYLVIDSVDYSSIPWSARVRFTEFLNTFDRNALSIIFGSGLVSSINDNLFPFVFNSSEYLKATEYSLGEISEGVYYGLHNFPRGFLHYGFIYYAVVIVLFLENVKRIRVNYDFDRMLKMINVYFFVQSLWNPSILFVYLMLQLVMHRVSLPATINPMQVIDIQKAQL